jgi:hypothetical protein
MVSVLVKSRNLALALLATCLLAGCGEDNYGGEIKMSAAESQAAMEQRIKDIENNPKMPQQAKDIAIASIRNSSKMGPPADK